MAKEKKKGSFWADFKKFISRGNVIDMAVGVVVGGAFGKIVTGFVNYIINPFIGLFIKNGSLDSIKTIITPEVLDEVTGAVVVKEVAILWGTWLQTIIDFLIIALCIFVCVKIICSVQNKIKEKEIKAKEEADKLAAEQAEKDSKAQAEADALKAEEEKAFRASIVAQESLLKEILLELKNK